MISPISFAASGLVALSLAAVVISGCGRSDDAPDATLTPETTGAMINFDFDSEISAEDRSVVGKTIEMSRSFFARELGRDLQLDIIVKVTTDDGGGLLGLSYGRTAWILTGGENWPRTSTLDGFVTKEEVVAHELFHNFQWDLMYTDDAIPGQPPWWILEGSAEYAAWRYLADRYGLEWTEMVAPFEVAVDRDLPALSNDTRALDDFGNLYAKAFLAIDSLMEDKPLSVLGDYFVATGRMDWDVAFEQTFGVEPSAFLEEFESTFLLANE